MAKKSRKKNYGLYVHNETGRSYIFSANTTMPTTLMKYNATLRKRVEFKLKK